MCTKVICLDCLHYGEAVETEVLERPDEFGPVTRLELTCAKCGEDDVDPCPPCLTCLERPVEVEGTDLCSHCYQAGEDAQAAKVARINARLRAA